MTEHQEVTGRQLQGSNLGAYQHALLHLAHAVTMMWKEHAPSQGEDTRPDGKPKLDFTAMNKLASIR